MYTNSKYISISLLVADYKQNIGNILLYNIHPNSIYLCIVYIYIYYWYISLDLLRVRNTLVNYSSNNICFGCTMPRQSIICM